MTTTPVIHSIDIIINKIKYPLEPVINSSGNIIYDDVKITLKCQKKHIHQYYLCDIVKINEPFIKCFTCSGGNKFVRRARNIAEEILKIPFHLIEENKDYKKFNAFIDTTKDISLICYNKPGANKINNNVIELYKTNSTKLYDIIYGLFIRLNGFTDIKQPPVCKRYIPYSPELAEITRIQRNITDNTLKPTDYLINDLYIENVTYFKN